MEEKKTIIITVIKQMVNSGWRNVPTSSRCMIISNHTNVHVLILSQSSTNEINWIRRLAILPVADVFIVYRIKYNIAYHYYHYVSVTFSTQYVFYHYFLCIIFHSLSENRISFFSSVNWYIESKSTLNLFHFRRFF